MYRATLRNWLRQDEADRGERSDVLTSEERRRLRELERADFGLEAAQPFAGWHAQAVPSF